MNNNLIKKLILKAIKNNNNKININYIINYIDYKERILFTKKEIFIFLEDLNLM